MSQVTGIDITNPSITFYGPYPCDLCGDTKVPIIRGSVSQGYGDIRLSYPNEPIYPNHKWEAHVCSSKAEAVFCESCDCFHAPGNHGEWIDRKDPRHSEYPNGKEDEFVPVKK